MGDYTNIINTAAEEAEIRGRAIGREEGRAEGRAEIVRQMFSKGMSAESIRYSVASSQINIETACI